MAEWDEINAGLAEGKSTLIQAQAKTLFKNLKNRTSAPDIALFGRMLAEKPELNIDAACQVAHAISTHQVNMEMDFYTAVDNLSTDEETGAGMMGVTGFNSACFYRYARLDFDQLVANLDGNVEFAQKTVEGFLRSAVLAVPGGKQNSFAAQNPPSFLLVVVRKDGASWSLANAFEKPIRPSRGTGLIAGSILALDSYWGRVHKLYGEQDVRAHALSLDDSLELPNLASALQPNLPGWLDAVQHDLSAQ